MKLNVNVKKRPGRKRRAAGWTLLALGVLVAGVCTVSYRMPLMTGTWERHEPGVINTYARPDRFGFRPLYTRTTSYFLSVVWGRVSVMSIEAPPEVEPGADVFPLARKTEEWPLHPAAAAALAIGGALVWSGRGAGRRRPGSCVACGYSLAGLAAGSPCPECGKAKVPA